MNGTEGISILNDLSNSIPGGMPIIFALLLLVVYTQSRNLATVGFIGIVLLGGASIFGIVSDLTIPIMLLAGIVVFHITTGAMYEDYNFRIFSKKHRRRHHMPHADATFIKKIMLVFGLAHKKENKNEQS